MHFACSSDLANNSNKKWSNLKVKCMTALMGNRAVTLWGQSTSVIWDISVTLHPNTRVLLGYLLILSAGFPELIASTLVIWDFLVI